MAGIASRKGPVRVHPMPFGAEVLPNGQGTRFRLWAPSARKVELMIEDHPYAMDAAGDGWFTFQTPQAGHGTLYRYRINGDLQVPDPASRFQPEDVHGPSQVIDPARFAWKDLDWRGRPWEETVLYELHVGAFSPHGNFKGVEEKLDYLAKLGVTAIELMPLSEFPGRRNWGYDGVLPFAPDSSYGRPDDLKDLVQAAHQRGLMVFLDVVYNHFGPEGNYLHAYAEPFFTERYGTPWGAALNFEGPQPVRDFFIHNALYWLNEYHLDGLRLDAVHAIYDESQRHFLMELMETVRQNVDPERHIHLVLENDDNAARYLSGNRNRYFNAQWNDDFHHAMHVLVSGDTGGYYADYARQTSEKSAVEHVLRCLTEGFAYQGDRSPYRQNAPRGEKSSHLPPTAFVNFLQNHDQIGNRAFGDRLITLSKTPEPLRAALSILLLAPSIPLIFMGEEWETRRPFLFFADFGPDLAPLVTEGRRKEFARFSEFSDPQTRQRIPDPMAMKTFEDSCLDWDEVTRPEHEVWLLLYKNLLTLRQRDIVPLLALLPEENETRHERLSDEAFAVNWPLKDGTTLMLAANLGERPLKLQLGDHPTLNLVNSKLIYQSEDEVVERLHSGEMPAWSVVWLVK